MDTPRSESSTTLKLDEIKKRCEELMYEPDGLVALTLDDALDDPNATDPYNHRRRIAE